MWDIAQKYSPDADLKIYAWLNQMEMTKYKSVSPATRALLIYSSSSPLNLFKHNFLGQCQVNIFWDILFSPTSSYLIWFLLAIHFSSCSLTWENQQCGLWPGLTQTRLYSHWRWLEAWNFVFRKKRYCTIQVAKTKALISFAVTAKLICVFVISKMLVSHDAAQL